MRSLGNFNLVNKRRYDGLHVYAWSCYSISVHKGFPRACILGRGISVPRLFVYFKGAEGLKYLQIVYYEKT